MNSPYVRACDPCLAPAAGWRQRRPARARPVMAITFAYALFSTFWVYVGVFAVNGLGASAKDVGLLFLLTAPLAAVDN